MGGWEQQICRFPYRILHLRSEYLKHFRLRRAITSYISYTILHLRSINLKKKSPAAGHYSIHCVMYLFSLSIKAGFSDPASPILNNLIAWITISTGSWRDVFNGKFGLIATHSAGSGQNFLLSMRIQLEHLGVIVLPRTIVVNKGNEFNPESCRSKIKQLIHLINQ